MLKGKYLLLFAMLLNTAIPLHAQTTENLKISLTSLFEIAEKNNRTLKIADYNEQIAAEQVKDVKKQLLPSLDVSFSASYLGDGWISDRDFSNGMKTPIPDFGNNFVLEANQIIYAGGAINTSLEIAKLGQKSAQLDKEKNKQDIRFAIAGYYLEMLKLNNQQQILKQNISQTQKLLEQIIAKFKQGTSLQNNTTRYELQLQALELALLKLENRKTIINNELVKILQLPKGTNLEADDALLSQELTVINSATWQTLALENSPIVQLLPIQAEQSKHQETLAKAGKKPKVFAFAANKLDGPITIEIPPIDKNFNYWYVGAGIKYDIASLYKTGTKVNLAKLSTQKVLENNALVKEDLTNEIEEAYLRLQETRKVHETQLKAVELATQNYTVIKNRYLNNLVLITEMLDAENAKLDAELQAANAQINTLFHFYKLKKLTGTL